MHALVVAVGTMLVAACTAAEQTTSPLQAASRSGFAARPAETGVSASPLGNYLAGRFARAERDTAAAADFFAQTLADDPDNPGLLRRTLLLMVSDGRFADARRLAERLTRGDPRDSAANLVLAVQELHDGRDGAAAERLEVLPRTGFNLLLAPMIGAWARYGEKQPEAALETLKPLRENAAFAAFYQFHNALLNDLAGRPAVAEESYRAALAASAGGSLRTVQALGNFLERRGRRDEARQVYQEYLDRSPENSVIAEALVDLDAGLTAPPLVSTAAEGAAEALYGAASVLSREDGGDAGEAYSQLALYLRPEFDLARSLLADIYEVTRRWERAIEAYRQIDDGSPLAWNARLRTAWALKQLDRTDEAAALLRQLANQEPDRIDAMVTLGDVYRGEENFAAAADSYGQAIDRVDTPEERHWSLFYARGIAYERLGRWPEAEADLLRALELKPDQPLVLNYLGYSWVEKGFNFDRALGMIQRAVQLRPNDGYIVDSLGWVLYRLGRFDEAVGQLERAVELRPEDPTINDHLGDALWRVGRRAEARFQWRRALSLQPDAALVPTIQSKLQTGLNSSAETALRQRDGG